MACTVARAWLLALSGGALLLALLASHGTVVEELAHVRLLLYLVEVVAVCEIKPLRRREVRTAIHHCMVIPPKNPRYNVGEPAV